MSLFCAQRFAQAQNAARPCLKVNSPLRGCCVVHKFCVLFQLRPSPSKACLSLVSAGLEPSQMPSMAW